jgi:hypothetical protein
VKEALALRVLGEIMSWDDDQASREYRWLSLISRLKYDGYQDFLAGVRFVESLCTWIQQFEPADRAAAYAFVRNVVVYIGPGEMLRLVELFFPDHVQRKLMRAAAEARGIPRHRVWSDPGATAAFERMLRSTLFIGLSEGARLDQFRRANAGIISNEQVLLATYVEGEKWDDLLKDLRDDLKDDTARFAMVYLIDDLVASGTTFIRKDAGSGRWKGKLNRFRRAVGEKLATHFDPNLLVCVHHYVANHRAVATLSERQGVALAELGEDWFPRVEFTFGTVLPESLPIDCSTHPDARGFIPVAMKYYDSKIENKHTWEGGTSLELGFAGCALPLVLEHNTPNNSAGLLWAESRGNDGSDGEPARHAMRPLFRRRQRHA